MQSRLSILLGFAMNIEQIYGKGDVQPGERERGRREEEREGERGSGTGCRQTTQYARHSQFAKKKKGGEEKKGVVVTIREKLDRSG